MWTKELEAAKHAAVEAGEAIMEIYLAADQIEVEYKEEDMPLTKADKAANERIVRHLKEQFPQYAILSEEMKDDPSYLCACVRRALLCQ